MSTILITGATGKLGRTIIAQLDNNEYEILALSSRQHQDWPFDVELIYGDLTDEASLQKAVARADIIIHAASNPLDPQLVDIKGTQNLLTALGEKPLKHFIYISIAGVDNTDYPYHRAKYEVEKMIKASPHPWSILRATQFHDLVYQRIIKTAETADQRSLKIPAGLKFQSIDLKDVAEKIGSLLQSGPLDNVITIGGPEIMTMEEMASQYQEVLGKDEEIITYYDESVAFHQVFRSGVNICPEQRYGKIRWRDYLKTIIL